MKKLLVVLLAAAMCISLLAGCSSSSNNTATENSSAWQALRAMMEAKNINIVAEFVADDQYQSTLQTRFASMNSIPMFCYNNLSDNEVMALAQNGQILDILPLIEGGDGTAKNFFEVNEFGKAGLATDSSRHHSQKGIVIDTRICSVIGSK